jgi:hypothetical protein
VHCILLYYNYPAKISEVTLRIGVMLGALWGDCGVHIVAERLIAYCANMVLPVEPRDSFHNTNDGCGLLVSYSSPKQVLRKSFGVEIVRLL